MSAIDYEKSFALDKVWNDKFPAINLHNFPKMINEHDIKDMRPEGWDKDKGNKFDADKPPMALLDPAFLEGVAGVLGFGANKYAANNWRNGIAYTRLISAAYRHLGAINRGEDVDPESGLSHSYHLGCCVMFLASMMHTRPDLDDRWKA